MEDIDCTISVSQSLQLFARNLVLTGHVLSVQEKK
jgi:hypothetical protein